jgi:hypothetical protein
VTTRWIVISLRVRVPVLSVQMTDAEPRASTALSFFTSAWRFAMRWTPIASTTERMVGSPSGTAATASETPSSSTTTRPLGEVMPSTRMTVIITTRAMITTMMPRVLPMRLISFCSGVGSSTVASIISAIAPTSVDIPVPVMTARPTPWTTAVPL